MRLFVQTASLMLLIIVGWNQPMRDLAAKLLPWADIAPSRLYILTARAEGLRMRYAALGEPPNPNSQRRWESNGSGVSRDQASH